MNYKKYDIKDFVAIVEGTKTVQEVAKKYHTTISAINRAMQRANVWKKKIEVKMITPYKTEIFSSVNECAKAIGVSEPTIMKVIKGGNSRILNELEIEVEVYKRNYAEEEYDY